MVYLDYAANHPADPAVVERFCKTELAFPGNPNSAHPAGLAAAEELRRVTAGAAALLGADPAELIFTSGATESNNLAIKGTALAARHQGKHILSTQLEHPSVGGSLTALQEKGYEIDLVPIRRDGTVDTEAMADLLREDTVLVAVSAVDSELGVIQPLEEIKALVSRAPNCHLHVDLTQAVGRIPISLAGIDTAALAAHKFGGLNGSGLLFKRAGLVIQPLFHGGASLSLYRSGTPALALASALECALDLALSQREARFAHVAALNARLRKALAAYPRVRINSPPGAVPHILNLSVPGIRGSRFQQTLAQRGVCVSVKSACSADALPSKAVFAVSRDRKTALASWRVSLSHLTTPADIDAFLEAFDACYHTLQQE